jgi:hypothetical protein
MDGLGTHWARIGHAHGHRHGRAGHGTGGRGTSGLGLGERHGTGEHGTDEHGTDWARARAGWAWADCVRTSRVPTSERELVVGVKKEYFMHYKKDHVEGIEN